MKTVFQLALAFVFLAIADLALRFLVPSSEVWERVLISLWSLFWVLGLLGMWAFLFGEITITKEEE